MKLLVAYDGMHDTPEQGDYDILLNLRQSDLSVSELMDIYETIEPESIAHLREKVLEINPDAIIAVGYSKEYRWVGTILCRIFGQFNSWNGQRGNAYGKTVLNIGGKSVQLIAIDSFNDYDEALSLLQN